MTDSRVVRNYYSGQFFLKKSMVGNKWREFGLFERAHVFFSSFFVFLRRTSCFRLLESDLKEAFNAKNEEKLETCESVADISPGDGGVAFGVTLNGVGDGAGGDAAGRRSEGAPEKKEYTSYLKLHRIPIILPPCLPLRYCGIAEIMLPRQLRQSADDMSGVHCVSP
jgi:hypothetical protein